VTKTITAKQKAAIRKVASARNYRNPFVGKSHEKFYCIDAATMRIIKQLAK